ncbi:MAG: 3-hydroxyacyl-CoA dehydrogenase family protein [Actinobacteria bacterium]|nr:3-hydroxyacyl-CoA dehydrogenase family protein [Actinomycetota bacterium]
MSETLGIAGSGTIACGLAVAAAGSGHDVKLRARSEESAAKARASIEKQCGRLENAEAALANVQVVTDLAELADRSFVVEAIAEEYDAKTPLLQELAGLIGEDTVLASTTSSLSVNELASRAGLADRFVGFHVFNPVPVMKLIEIVYPDAAGEDTKSRSRELCEAIGKTGVEVPDTPGFVVNRLLFPYLFDAAKFQQETGLEPEAVDTCMKLGAGLPMGPLALLDYVGMDVSIAIGEQIDADIPQNCRDLLAAGKLGRKSGAGFYDYSK